MTTILFILHLPPPVHGASMVGKYIHDSKIVNETFDCHYINLTTAKDLTDIGKVGIRKLKVFISLLKQIRREVKRLRPQLVYVTPNACGGAFYKDFIVVQMLKSMGCRVVLHYHNKGVSTRQDRRLDDFLYRSFFKDVKVMLLAEALYKDVKKYVSRENVLICGNGIPDVSSGMCAAKDRDDDTPRLLFLSNMLTTKGVWELVEALALLKEKGLRFVCDFVGGWKDITPEDFNMRLREKGLTGCVQAHGAKYGQEKEEFFNRADIFVFPTYYPNECFPLVLLEAMSHGIACVSTNEGGISSIVDNGKTGILVEKQNPRQLAAALEELMLDMDRCHAMGQEGQARYCQEFTLQRFEERFCGCLQACTDRLHTTTPPSR
ncbi:MAG: glycosyltransferase family 4 protein [Clostridium sp.]|nr:glycosyltransferase family 4 protein [Clostridium sp.]